MGNDAAEYVINGITFNNEVPDADGLTWYATITNGMGGPAAEFDKQQFMNDHGEDYLGGLYRPRVLAIEGSVYGPDRDSLRVARNKLGLALQTASVIGKFTINEPGQSSFFEFYREDEIKFRYHSDRWADYQFTLIAPDPRRYSVVENSIALDGNTTNIGNMPSFPRFEVPAAGAGLHTFSIGGRAITMTLDADGLLEIITKRRIVRLNNFDRYDMIDPLLTTWSAIPPGATAIAHTGGGAVTVFWRHAWIS